MRYIQKKDSPQFFEKWQEKYASRNGGSPNYNDLRGEDYHDLKTHIIDEQYGLCCYCMKEIMDYNSHIEHFKPQGQFPDEALNYGNLLVSCNGLKDKNENCGHKKDNWYSSYYTVSPLDEKCEELFTYTVNGHIKPNNGDKRSEKTIEQLELDSDLLQRARRSAIYISGLFDEDFDSAKKDILIGFYSTSENGKLKGFCNAIIYCLKQE